MGENPGEAELLVRGALNIWAALTDLDPSVVEIEAYPPENPRTLGVYVMGELAFGTSPEEARNFDTRARILKEVHEKAKKLGILPRPPMAEDELKAHNQKLRSCQQ